MLELKWFHRIKTWPAGAECGGRVMLTHVGLTGEIQEETNSYYKGLALVLRLFFLQ